MALLYQSGRQGFLRPKKGPIPKRTDRRNNMYGANGCSVHAHSGRPQDPFRSPHFPAASTNSSTSSVRESFLCTGCPACSLDDGWSGGIRPEEPLLDAFWVSSSLRSRRSWEGALGLAFCFCAGVVSSSPKSMSELSLPCVWRFCRLGECGGISN